jgi:hypothetical protein
MNGRLKFSAIVVLVGGLVLAAHAAFAAPQAANSITTLHIDSTCSTTHQVTMATFDVTAATSVVLVGQVQINGTFTDSGPQVTVQIPAHTGFVTVSSNPVVTVQGSGPYQVRVVSSTPTLGGLQVSDPQSCTGTPTPTSTPTSTSTPTPTPTLAWLFAV